MKEINRFFTRITFLFLILINGVALFAAPKPTVQTIPGNREYYTFPQFFIEKINTGLSFTDKNDYSQAIKELSATNINDGEWNESLESSKRNDTIAAKINDLQKSYKDLTVLSKNFATSLDNLNSTAVNYTTFNQLLSQQKNIWLKTEEISQINASVERSFSRNETTYFVLIQKLSSGVSGNEATGILGAVNTALLEIYKASRSEIQKGISQELTKLNDTVTKGKIESFSVTKQSCVPIINSIKNSLNQLSNFTSVASKISDNQFNALKILIADNIKSDSFLMEFTNLWNVLADNYQEFSNRITEAQSLSQPDSPLAYLRQHENSTLNNQSYEGILIACANNLAQCSRTATSLRNSQFINDYQRLSQTLKTYDSALASWNFLCNSIINNAGTEATRTWIKCANFFLEGAKECVKEYESSVAQIANYKEYPTRGLKVIEEVYTSSQKDIFILQKCNQYLDDGYQYRTNFTEQRNALLQSIQQVKNLSEKAAGVKNEYLALQKQALNAASEIEMFYSRAVASFNAQNFTQSHNYLDRANESYNANLEELKKDKDIQEQKYKELTDLRQDFIKREMPVLINEIRQYKNQAKNNYYSGDFESANAILLKAETRKIEWAKLMDTEVEYDEELQRLKEMVNTALTIKEGRIIYSDDPLYMEMSVLLNSAQSNYETGKRLFESGNTQEGKEYLEKAKTLTDSVKLIYPRNQRASIISMRSDMILDKENFNQFFAERITALKKVNYALQDVLAQESYNELLDLYEINNNYAGLKAFINQVEIDLGLRQKPVSNTNIQRAQTLIQEAKNLFASANGNYEQLELAKQKANEALSLNSNSDAALKLLDDISLTQSQNTAVTLSAQDEELYQKAVKELSQNHVFNAKQIVDQLLAKPQNSKSAKILKLQKRIEALL